MCVCVIMYIYIHTCVYIYMCIYIHLDICVYGYTFAYYTYIFTFTRHLDEYSVSLFENEEIEMCYYGCVRTIMQHFANSAILYLNDDFGGGELFFTNRDAKTVTVSCSFQPWCHFATLLPIFIWDLRCVSRSRPRWDPAVAAWWVSLRALWTRTALLQWPVVGGVR